MVESSLVNHQAFFDGYLWGCFQKAVFLKLKWFHNAMALDLVITSFVVCIHTHSVLCIVYDGSCHVLFAKLKVLVFSTELC